MKYQMCTLTFQTFLDEFLSSSTFLCNSKIVFTICTCISLLLNIGNNSAQARKMSCTDKHSSCQVKGLFLLSQSPVLAQSEACFSLLLERQLLRQLMYNSSAHSFKVGKGAGVLLGDHSAPGLAGRQLLRSPQLHFKSSQLPPPSSPRDSQLSLLLLTLIPSFPASYCMRVTLSSVNDQSIQHRVSFYNIISM